MQGYSDRKDEVLNRLRRIEGQVRGIARLVDEDTYCIDVLTQISAVQAALRGVTVGLLDGHVRHCVRDSIRETGGEEKVDELVAAVTRIARD